MGGRRRQRLKDRSNIQVYFNADGAKQRRVWKRNRERKIYEVKSLPCLIPFFASKIFAPLTNYRIDVPNIQEYSICLSPFFYDGYPYLTKWSREDSTRTTNHAETHKNVSLGCCNVGHRSLSIAISPIVFIDATMCYEFGQLQHFFFSFFSLQVISKKRRNRNHRNASSIIRERERERFTLRSSNLIVGSIIVMSFTLPLHSILPTLPRKKIDLSNDNWSDIGREERVRERIGQRGVFRS